MEELLFYSYLSYQKARKGSLKNRILKLPKVPLCFCLLSLLSMGVALVALICNALIITVMAVVIELIFCFALEYSIEKHKIHHSEKRIKDFCAYCFDLKAWVVSNSFDDTGKIAEIKDRIEKRIAVYKKEQETLMLCGTAFVVLDTLENKHSHLHTHIIKHTHGGTTHTHIVTHEHSHNHIGRKISHQHRHRINEIIPH